MWKEGDVVQIINLSSDQLNSISSQRCIKMEDAILLSKAIIGMAYIIDEVNGNKIKLKNWNHGGHFVYFEPDQFISYL